MSPSTVGGRLTALVAAVAPLLLFLPTGPAGASEADRIFDALALRPGARVADVGAGDGEWTERLARQVGPEGHVWATEVEAEKVEKIESRLARASLENVTTLLGHQHDTGLPADCCDAILLRLVYHHFQDPAPMRASLKRALRPGGRLVIVDVAPKQSWPRLEGVPDRGGHGIPVEELVREVRGDGFEVLDRHDDWSGEADYCLVLRAPDAAQ